MRQRVLAPIVTAFVCLASSANAATITFAYAGVVNIVSGDLTQMGTWLNYTPVVGDSLNVVFSFSSTAGDHQPAIPDYGVYSLDSMSFTIGPATSPTARPGAIDVVNDSTHVQGDVFAAFALWPESPVSNATIRAGLNFYFVSSAPDGPFSSDALPLVPPSPSAFEVAGLTLEQCTVDGGSCYASVYARSAVQAVPIPAVGWLIGPALGVLGWVKRRVTN